MANEVEIRITAHDLTGPAFASVMAKLDAAKKLADEAFKDRQFELGIGDALTKLEVLKRAADDISFGHINMSDLNTGLMALRSKMQSLGIADLADIDVQPGRLMTQLQLIKRLINQSGVSDVLDFNLTPADLSADLHKLGAAAIDIPIKFDMSKMPKLGQIGTEHVPVTFDFGREVGPHEPILNVPANIDVKEFVRHGETMPILDIPAKIDIANLPKSGDFEELGNAITGAVAAEQNLSTATNALGVALTAADIALPPFVDRVLRMGEQAGSTSKYMSLLGMSLAELIPWSEKIADVFSHNTIPNMKELARDAERSGAILLDALSVGLSKSSDAVDKFSRAMDSGIKTWKNGDGVLGRLNGRLQLFGGWLTKLGAPEWVGTVTGLHILTEGIVELSAVLIPAGIAFGAFAAAAVPTIGDMYTAEKNMFTVSQALGMHLPGLSDEFSKMADAVKPEVYILAGEALDTINGKTGEFKDIAVETGRVVDDLGARIEVALGSQGMSSFIAHGVDDLSLLANSFGNVFGIIGNLLKSMPGYAEILLNVFHGITGALEDITSSGAAQGLVGLALGLHGAIFYAGLAGTALLALRGPLTSIVTWAIDGIATVAALGSAFLEEAASAGIAAAATDTLKLANPWLLAAAGVALVVGGVIALVSWLGNAKSAQQQYLDSVENTINAQSAFSGIISVTRNAISTTNAELAKTPEYTTRTQVGMHGITSSVTTVNSAYQQLQSNSQKLTGQLGMEQSRQKQLIGIFGSSAAAQNAMSQAGIKLSDIANANAEGWAKDIVELKALNSATVQLAGYQRGQAAAAQNALNVMGGTITQIQKITQAEDGLMNVITGGVTAFDTFALGQQTLSQNFNDAAKSAATVTHSLGDIKSSAKLTGAVLGGTSQASLTLSQAFYQQVGNAQKVIDALQQQQVGYHDLTTAVATEAGQMLQFAGNNDAARSTMVAMINNALGPGTVRMQTLDGWVRKNSTSMSGFASIVAKAQEQAASLANVLQNDLNSQFQADLLASSGANAAMKKFTDAVVHGGTSTAAYRGARAQLIADLEATGMNATDATKFVDGLQRKIDAMHGKTVAVNANTGQAIAAINQVQAYLNGLHNKTVYATVVQQVQVENTIPVPGGIGGGALRAVGGIVGNMPHAATGGYRQGLTMVGELGPELVRLPAGSQVYPHGITPGYASQGGMNSIAALQLEIDSSGQSAFEQFMIMAIREWVRVKGGGNVQKAFGRNK